MDTGSQQSPADIQSLVQNIELEITRFQTLVTNEDDKIIRYKVGFVHLNLFSVFNSKVDLDILFV